MTLSTKKKEEFNSLCVAFLQKIQAFKPKKNTTIFYFFKQIMPLYQGY